METCLSGGIKYKNEPENVHCGFDSSAIINPNCCALQKYKSTLARFRLLVSVD